MKTLKDYTSIWNELTNLKKTTPSVAWDEIYRKGGYAEVCKVRDYINYKLSVC